MSYNQPFDSTTHEMQAGGEWSLFCPNEAPGLADCWGDAFEELYSKYEREGRARKTIKAQQLWFAIMEAQVETGNPYMLFKDAANRKSNQQNLGTIKSSNLCTGTLCLFCFFFFVLNPTTIYLPLYAQFQIYILPL